jgi:glycosyltransferase-like protein
VLVPVRASRADTAAYVRACVAAYVAALGRALPRFDVYHAHDGISGNALATLVERGRIPRFVRTVHHLDDFGSGELAALQDRSVVRADRCLVVSRLWRDRLARMYGIDATVVPNGVDMARFAPLPAGERARVRMQLGIGAEPFFVTIGGVEARKNTIAALDAFALVRRTRLDARFAIAGGASIFGHRAYRRAFTERTAELGFADSAALAVSGVLRDDVIVALLRAADAFVFPSVREGFGLVVLEALACGTPVVTSSIPPFTEYLGPGDALLADPSDPRAIAMAMLAALEPVTAAALAARGPRLARRFGWARSARLHANAYRAFVGARTRIEGGERYA